MGLVLLAGSGYINSKERVYQTKKIKKLFDIGNRGDSPDSRPVTDPLQCCCASVQDRIACPDRLTVATDQRPRREVTSNPGTTNTEVLNWQIKPAASWEAISGRSGEAA